MIRDSEIRGVRDRVLMLHSLETLSGLQDEDLSILAERMRLRHFDVGDVLLDEQHAIESVYFILEGTVRIERAGSTIGNLHRGTAAGFYALLAGDDRGVLATAQEPTTAFELSVGVLTRALHRFPTLLRHFTRLTASALLVSRGCLPIDDKQEEIPCGQPAERHRTLAERILAFSQSARVLPKVGLSAAFEMVLQATEERIDAGQTLWREGDTSTSALAIDQGRIRCSCASGRTSAICGPFMLGRLETLAGVPRPYGAVAETDLLALRIQRETWYSVLEAHPDVGMALLSRLSADMLEAGWAGLGTDMRTA